MQRIVQRAFIVVAIIAVACAPAACSGGGSGQTRTPPQKQEAPGQGMKEKGEQAGGEESEEAPPADAPGSGG
jgi:hypothetical protein